MTSTHGPMDTQVLSTQHLVMGHISKSYDEDSGQTAKSEQGRKVCPQAPFVGRHECGAGSQGAYIALRTSHEGLVQERRWSQGKDCTKCRFPNLQRQQLLPASRKAIGHNTRFCEQRPVRLHSLFVLNAPGEKHHLCNWLQVEDSAPSTTILPTSCSPTSCSPTS